MAGVGGLSSLGLFLLLLLASSSAAREERLLTRAWSKLETKDLQTYNYLALLQTEGAPAPVCSGSIPSKWTVLTFCKDAAGAGKTKAYAGVLTVAEAVPTAGGNIQVRDVKAVAANGDMEGLKICILNEAWTDKVGVVELPKGKRGDPIVNCTLLGFGGSTGAAQKLTEQKIGAKECTTAGTTAGELDMLIKNDDATLQLKKEDFGGPVVCANVQRGINKLHKTMTRVDGCNVLVDVAHFIPWIEEQKQAAEEAGASGGTGGTGGNGTSPSSGYSIHTHLNKYSNWKVLWFLVPTIVTFLQY